MQPKLLSFIVSFVMAVVACNGAAPETLKGIIIQFTIDSGDGEFARSGKYYFFPEEDSGKYWINVISGDSIDSKGGFVYEKTGENTATLLWTDSSSGKTSRRYLFFTTPNSGTFEIFLGRQGKQSGRFSIESRSPLLNAGNLSLSDMVLDRDPQGKINLGLKISESPDLISWETVVPSLIMQEDEISIQIDPNDSTDFFKVFLKENQFPDTINLGKDFYINFNGQLNYKESIKMIWVEPGEFMMGSPDEEPFRSEIEKQHLVALPEGFWLAEAELTIKQWEALKGKDSSSNHEADKMSPIYGINWDSALQYCDLLNTVERILREIPEGYQYSLPTEAQWEYACRAGTTTAYSFGPSITSQEANCNRVSGVTTGAIAVKSYMPNSWGFYDMHGNVSEWCMDWYGEYQEQSQVNPTGPVTGEYKIVRGGSWYFFPEFCRSAYRVGQIKTSQSQFTGFRIVLQKI